METDLTQRHEEAKGAKAQRLKMENIEHPTPNIEHRMEI
jgi:hypothetical protein